MLTMGYAQGEGENGCPDTSNAMMANATNCLNVMNQMKCDGSYVVVKMTGQDKGVPCQWSRRMNLCNGRIDCAFDYSNNTQGCTTNPTTPAFRNQCQLINTQGQCDDSYTIKKSTGKRFQYPCRWTSSSGSMGVCVEDAKCGQAMAKLTSSPSMPPTVTPTINPTIVPTTVPTMPPTFVPTQSPTTTPTQRPTSNPTRMPTRMPTNPPTFADICDFFNGEEASCVAFACHYNPDTDICTLAPFDGHHCHGLNSKKCKKDTLCFWNKSIQDCEAANYPTMMPSTMPTTGGICDLFFDQFSCDAWTQFAGCHWDLTQGLCLEGHQTKAPTAADPCLGLNKKACRNTMGCDLVGGTCSAAAAPTMLPTPMPNSNSCYVDFLTYDLLGQSALGIQECNDKGVDCEVVTDPFWGNFCEQVVCSTVTVKTTCQDISHCRATGGNKKFKCIDA